MRFKIVILLVIFSGLLVAENFETPQWLNSKEPIDKDKISANDEAYLKNWIATNSMPAADYLVEKCQNHQIVIIGEQHNISEHKTFLTDNLRTLYEECGVRAIGWEFSRAADNDWLERIINLPEFDEKELLSFARQQSAHEWNSIEHWEMIKEVWEINDSIENPEDKMRFFGIDINDDLCDLVDKMGKPENKPEYEKTMETIKKRDITMAENVITNIIEPGYKGIIFVGRCHDYTHHQLAAENPFSNHIMGNILQDKYGDKVFQIWQYSGWFGIAGRLIEDIDMQMIGFDNYNSPFANVLQETGWKFDVPAPFGNIARGFIYLKPVEELSKNSTYPGFITDELLGEYKKFYEMNYGREFNSAEELDKFIQENRW